MSFGSGCTLKMKIAIYHPGIKTMGGGETVSLTIASALSRAHSVDLICHENVESERLQEFFGLNLSKVRFRVHPQTLHIFNTLKTAINLKSTYPIMDEYDLIIDTFTNGWFDRKLKAKTICYIHYPFFYPRKKGLKSIINPFMIFPDRAFCYDKILCNSNFTKQITSKMTEKKVDVLYPPVQTSNIKPRKKQNIIVSVGRFTYDKKHEVMIKAFKEFYKHQKGYELHLIGQFMKDVGIYKKSYLRMLEEQIKGYPIWLHMNMPHEDVLRFLEKSRIYWHARGYGETDPNEYENFGITTVEAMAAGCIPIVINLGAQPEVVGKGGLIWDNPAELPELTTKAIQGPDRLTQAANAAAKKFSLEIFLKGLNKALKSLE